MTQNNSNSLIKVSVILPVFSGQDTLEKCIKSIIKQKIQGFDLIVLDDGSADKSSAAIIRLLEKSPVSYKIIVHDRNQGIASTLNEGIKIAKGDYVLIIHQDCELISDKYLEAATNFFEKHQNAIAICGKPFYPVHEFNLWETTFMIHSGHFNHKILNESEDISFSEHKCDLFKKKVLSRTGGFDHIKFKISGEDQIKSLQLKNLGYVFIRNNRLAFIQRYGKSVASFKGLLKRVFRYGTAQSKVILLTHGMILAQNNRTNDLKTRIKNRCISTLSALFFISFGLALILSQNSIFTLPMFAAFLARMFYLVLQKNKNKIEINNRSLLVACFVAFLADVIYFIGLSFGMLAFIGCRIYKKSSK